MDTKKIEILATAVLDAAFRVHRRLGPGLLESTYKVCIGHELHKAGIAYRSEVALPIVYEDLRLECGYRIDLFVEDCLIVELKSVEKLLPIHTAQILSYLRLSERRLGLLINFNSVLLKDGVKRVVNRL